jgi:hypothetical protein
MVAIQQAMKAPIYSEAKPHASEAFDNWGL